MKEKITVSQKLEKLRIIERKEILRKLLKVNPWLNEEEYKVRFRRQEVLFNKEVFRYRSIKFREIPPYKLFSGEDFKLVRNKKLIIKK